MNPQQLAEKINKNLKKIDFLHSTVNANVRQLIEIGAQKTGSLSALADMIGVSHAYLSRARNSNSPVSDNVRGDLIHLLAYNICTGCGAETESDVCPAGCKSRHDPTAPKPTLPLTQVPANCWDCGQKITTPPHQRAALGQCEQCAAKGN